jgi:nucleotide-binding universal stress UspA family protein
MKKILVPTDFSDQAYFAAETAAAIAKKTEAEIILLHIIDIPTYSENTSIYGYQDTAEALFVMKLTKKRFKSLKSEPFFKGIKVTEAVQFDNVYETISEQARKQKIDLIVMGSHGSSGISEMFIGSNTEKVVRLAHCPVLTVKNKPKNFSVEDVVFVSDFSDESYSVFTEINNFIQVYNARIHLLKVISPNFFETTQESKKSMYDFAVHYKLKKFTTNIYNHYDVESGVLAFAKENRIGFIAIETNGRKGISRILNGSITESIVNHAEVSVLSMRRNKKDEKKMLQVKPDKNQLPVQQPS